MQVATELDLLSVAVRNVLRAQARIPEQYRPEMGGGQSAVGWQSGVLS
jgi:hypothetical protein